MQLRNTFKKNDMTTITLEMRKAAREKVFGMPLGSFSRLKLNGEVSDIVISPSSSGVYFYNVPNTIGCDIIIRVIGFIRYSEL